MTNPKLASRLAVTVAALILGAGAAGGAAVAAESGHAGPHIERLEWSFAGPFGHYDPAQLQRGFKVYREVCSACHGLKRIAFRNLGEPGGPLFGEAQVKQLASEYQIVDGPNDEGEMYERPGRPSDRIPSPYPNDQAARAAQGGALPPDLSLIAKARAVTRGFPWFVLDAVTQYQEQGPDYVHALLTGYTEPPAGVEVAPGMHYNPNFISGSQLAMPPPLSDDLVEYPDGAPQTVDQYATDVAAFLMWAAEPSLDERKQIGFKAMLFMVVFAGLLYFTKRKLWSKVDH